MNTWLINVSKGGREFGTCFYYNLLSNLWESSSFPPTANIFEGYNASLSQPGNTSISYKFNYFSLKWSKMKTNMKGCIAKIKTDWVREYDFDSVRGYDFKRNFHTNLSEYENIKFLLSTHFQGSFEFQTPPPPHFSHQVIQGYLNFWFPGDHNPRTSLIWATQHLCPIRRSNP